MYGKDPWWKTGHFVKVALPPSKYRRLFYNVPPISPPYQYGDPYWTFINQKEIPEGRFRVIRVRGFRKLLGQDYIVVCPEEYFPPEWEGKLIKIRDVANISKVTKKFYVATRRSLVSVGDFEKVFG